MSATDLLAELQKAHVQFEVRGDRLRARGPADVLTPEVVERLRAHKGELLALLPLDSVSGVTSALPAASGCESAAVCSRETPRAADLLDGTVAAEHRDATGWRLFSRALARELWIARDEATADELWVETGLPVVTLAEAAELTDQSIEVWRALLDMKVAFGPGVRLRV